MLSDLDGLSALAIPNAEIQEIFETTVMKWFSDSAKTWSRQILFDAVWKNDCELLTQEMNKLLRKTISYHDYKEDFYHAFLAGIFAGAGYSVESNKEHGEGRSDTIKSSCDKINKKFPNVNVHVYKIINDYFGHSITVTGQIGRASCGERV